MSDPQPNNPLHGVKLEQIVKDLVDHYGWQELGTRIEVRCFNFDPSVKSSLKFLRRTPWAREKVEELYLRMQGIKIRRQPRREPPKEAPEAPPIKRPEPGFVKKPKGA